MRNLTSILLACLFAAPALAAPATLATQGRLLDANGVALEGSQEVTFKLYASEAATEAAWSETQTLALDNGYYAAALGGTTPVSLDGLGDGAWLGITIGGAELPQRLALHSAPYALWSAGARNLAGGTVDATEIKLNGTALFNVDGSLATSVDWSKVNNAPADSDALSDLECDDGQLLAYSAGAWGCADLDASDLSGTVGYEQIPVGTSGDTVASGDHTHAFAAITGTVALAQLPTGTGADQVALGNHGHDFAAITGTAAITQLPTGTGATQVALGNHGHAFAAITGTAAIAQLPTGTGADQVALGNHGHDAAAITSGTLNIARIPSAAILATAADAALPNYRVSCKAIKDAVPGAGNGYYTIDPDGAGFVAPYTVYCEQTLEGGGWTRIMSLDASVNYVSLDNVPNETEYVDNGTWQFSKTMLKASNREVLIVEKGSPNRMHKYDFKQGTNPQGEDFVGTITGDRAATVAAWNWTTGAWVSMGNGACNANNHSQWNCTPPAGIRFHYATRNWMNDGGTSVPTTWAWFTGYNTGYGNQAQLVKNWDGLQNQTAHYLYVR